MSKEMPKYIWATTSNIIIEGSQSNTSVGMFVDERPNQVELAEKYIRADLAGKIKLMDWLDIHYEENIYYGNNHCPAQILRNCVHPKEGKAILDRLKEEID